MQKNKIIELFSLLDKLNDNQYEEVKQWLQEQFLINTEMGRDLGIFFFALSEYLRCSKDISIFDKNEKEVNSLLDNSLSFILNRENDIKISQIAAIYGGLKGINNYVSRQDVGLKLKQIREFIFKNCIEKGKVVNYSSTNKLTYDILLACSPFGLFEPEDLVLVETVKELYKNSNSADVFEILLLANYYIEQGSYHIAKELFDNVADNNDFAGLLLLLKKKLSVKLKAGELAVIHKPYGNNNPYKPLACERFPKIVTQDDIVEISAQIWPETDLTKLFLKLRVNDKEEIIDGARIKDKDTYFQWKIGPFMPNDKISYNFITVENNNSREHMDTYEIDVCGRQRLHINEYNHLENYSELSSTLANGSKVTLYLYYKKQYVMLTTKKKPSDETLNTNVLCEFDLSEELITLCYGETRVTITDIYITFSDTSGIKKIELCLRKDENESFYGFGERYNDLNQAGNKIDHFVYNQYKDQGIKTYIPIPFYISSRGYGCFLKDNHYSWFDMGKENPDEIHMNIESPSLELNFFFGETKEVISKYTELTGKPKLLPKWAFGPWMSSNNWDSQDEVEKQMALTIKHDIPATVLVIEAWSDEVTYYIFNDAYYKRKPGEEAFDYEDFQYPDWGRWPNPKELVDKLHNNGLKCILWQIPVLKELSGGIHHLQKENDIKCAIDKGYVVRNSDGTPYRIPEDWFKDSYVLDFTSEEAASWWFNKRKYLVETLQVDGFKTDGGECIFGRDLKFANGATGKEMRNAYSNTYIGAYYNFVNSLHPEGGITFSRSGYTGAQNFPAHWAGDERSTFEAFKRSLYAGLSCGLSGIPFWGWDFAGFSGDVPTDELYLRATEMATFCPIMQYHAESKGEFNQDRTPWNIAERSGNPEVIPVFKYFAKLRMNLLPYIYSEAINYSLTGEPMMRAMLIDYMEDDTAKELYDQYMFGRKLLVAPIIEEGKRERRVYLPQGKWYGIFEAGIWCGPSEVEAKAEVNEIPVFIKENSVIPLALNEKRALGEYTGNSLYDYPIIGLIAVGDSIDEEVDFKEEGSIKFVKKQDKIVIDNFTNKNVCLIAYESKLNINNILSVGEKGFNGYYIHKMKVIKCSN